MAYIDISINPIFCLLRKNFLYNQEKGFGDYENAAIFGAYSAGGEALTFHCMTDGGAVYSRLPIHAFCHNVTPEQPLQVLQMWDCFGEDITEVCYDFLYNLRCKIFLKDKTEVWGRYVTTFDWVNNVWSEQPDQYKCAHLIALDNGNYALQPNNRILWVCPAFTKNPHALAGTIPDYKPNTYKWVCESDFEVEDDRYFYKVEE